MNIKNIIKKIAFVCVNPHLIPCIAFAMLLLLCHKSISYVADRLDDVARSLDRFDKSLAKKNIPTWLDYLVNGDEK